MHTVLDLEANGPIAENDETLEERLGKASSSSFLVHDDGSKLLMVSDKHHLLAAQDKGNHTF